MHTCFCMYWELGMNLHVLVCIIMCEPVSRAQHACACLSASGDSVMIRMCWPVSRAGRVFPCVFTIQEPGMQVQVSARIKSSACTSTSWPVSKAEHVSAWIGVRSEQCCCLLYWGLCVCLYVCMHLANISMRLGWSCYASACACKHQGLWMYLHWMAGIHTHTERSVYPHFISLYWGDEHWWVCIFGFYQELQISLHLLVCMDSWACVCVCLHMLRAGRVSSYVGRYQEHSMFQHVSARIKSRACFSLCLLRAEWVSSCVGMYQELSVSATSVCADWELHQNLDVLVHIEGWAWFSSIEGWESICMCWRSSRVGHDLAVLGAERVSARVLTFQEQGMQLHVSACVKTPVSVILNCLYRRLCV